ncbi:hypothetical protein GCM10010521_63100 [Streptomyces rameus]|uniref:Uncharacterized protein n=1 Tax=Streptomyces rameus TaxID=68261 RepID=A0ABN3V309_9ACTN
MTIQYPPARSRGGFMIQQIADRFEVYNPCGEFFGAYPVRAAAEKRVALLARHAERTARNGR